MTYPRTSLHIALTPEQTTRTWHWSVVYIDPITHESRTLAMDTAYSCSAAAVMAEQALMMHEEGNYA